MNVWARRDVILDTSIHSAMKTRDVSGILLMPWLGARLTTLKNMIRPGLDSQRVEWAWRKTTIGLHCWGVLQKMLRKPTKKCYFLLFSVPYTTNHSNLPRAWQVFEDLDVFPRVRALFRHPLYQRRRLVFCLVLDRLNGLGTSRELITFFCQYRQTVG